MANNSALERLKARQNGHSAGFNPLDSLAPVLTVTDKDDIVYIPDGRLNDFSGHTFKHGTELSGYELAILDSIKTNGIMEPLIIRKASDNEAQYEIIAGHTRRRLGRMAGLDEFPCVIRELDDNAAIIHMVESNLQRPDWLPSEKAASYKAHYDATARSWGKLRGRPKNGADSSSADPAEYSVDRLRDAVAQRFGISGVMLMTYIKLNDLSPRLLDLVDSKRLTVKAGYQIAYLDTVSQEALLRLLAQYPHIKVDDRKAVDLRNCDRSRWPEILGIKKAKKAAGPQVKITLPFSRIRFPKEVFASEEFTEWLIEAANERFGPGSK